MLNPQDDGFGPKKPAVDPDDPVAREFSPGDDHIDDQEADHGDNNDD